MANKAIPTSLRLVRGNPGRRPLPADEPQPNRKAPPMPDHLDPLAQEEWKRLEPLFLEMGILTEVDGFAFSSLVSAYAEVARYDMALRECGYAVMSLKHSFMEKEGRDGRSDEVMAVEPKANPLYSQRRLAMTCLRFWCNEFGVTPSSRGKIAVPKGKKVDPGEDFLNGR